MKTTLAVLFSIILTCLTGCTRPPTLPDEQPDTTPSTGDQVVCTTEYAPVCGETTPNCQEPPCAPIRKTYSNACEADKAGAEIIAEGSCPEIHRTGNTADRVEIISPLAGSSVDSPIEIQTRLPGNWLFEASAPVVLTNRDGLIIAEGTITTPDDRMTTDLVVATGSISFELDPDSYSDQGYLILQKANPSGLPENDEAVEIPVLLD